MTLGATGRGGEGGRAATAEESRGGKKAAHGRGAVVVGGVPSPRGFDLRPPARGEGTPPTSETSVARRRDLLRGDFLQFREATSEIPVLHEEVAVLVEGQAVRRDEDAILPECSCARLNFAHWAWSGLSPSVETILPALSMIDDAALELRDRHEHRRGTTSRTGGADPPRPRPATCPRDRDARGAYFRDPQREAARALKRVSSAMPWQVVNWFSPGPRVPMVFWYFCGQRRKTWTTLAP